jgi:cytochrome c-type protein NapC
MRQTLNPMLAVAGALFALAGSAQAAPDWGKAPKKTITVFYPGTSSLEWTFIGTEHGGARAMRKGETCASCHDAEAADMGKKIVTGQKLEPDATAVKGKAGSIPVTVQAAYDASNIYVRFQWMQPAASGNKQMDEKNAVKLAVMLDDSHVEYGALGGCWASCHHDLRSMPHLDPNASKNARAKELDIRSDGPTKYLKESRTLLEMKLKPLGGWDKAKTEPEYTQLLNNGKFLEMWQYRSSESPRAGYVLESRRLKSAPGLAEGKNEGGNWTVTFTRKLAGGTGVHAIAPGKTYPIGFAIHDDHSNWRFHHVSLGYTLGLDNPKADINAVKQ